MTHSPNTSGRQPLDGCPPAARPGLAQGLWRDPLLLGAFLMSVVLVGYQLAVTLLQPSWSGPGTDWLRAALAWPELLVVLFVSFWLTRTHRLGARFWWMFSAGLVAYTVARTLWTVDDQLIFPHHVPFPSLPDLFFVLQYPFFFLAIILVPGSRPWGPT